MEKPRKLLETPESRPRYNEYLAFLDQSGQGLFASPQVLSKPM